MRAVLDEPEVLDRVTDGVPGQDHGEPPGGPRGHLTVAARMGDSQVGSVRGDAGSRGIAASS